MEGTRGGQGSLIPEEVTESLNRSLANAEEVRTNLNEFLEIASENADVFGEMPAFACAQVLFVLAKAANALVALRLQCSGVRPDDHPIKTELERLKFYIERYNRCVGLRKEPLHPSTTTTTLNNQAATQHILPHLTTEAKCNEAYDPQWTPIC